MGKLTSGENSYYVYSVIESSVETCENVNPQIFVINYNANSQKVEEIAIDEFYQFVENVKPSSDIQGKFLKKIPEVVEELASQKEKTMGMTAPSMRLEGIFCGELSNS